MNKAIEVCCHREVGHKAWTALDHVGLTSLMARTRGSGSLTIGLIDGPVHAVHPSFAGSAMRGIGDHKALRCRYSGSASCAHGTFIATMLVGKCGGFSGICPDCTLLVRPVFHDSSTDPTRPPAATSSELAAAVVDCLDAGARVINLSLALSPDTLPVEPALLRAIEASVDRGVLLVAAAGNQNILGGTLITNHPWPISVMACDLHGWLSHSSNFGPALARRGLCAPGFAPQTSSTCSFGGTSVAAPYVTGTIALLWSLFPKASAQELKLALRPTTTRRAGLVAPMLNAANAYHKLNRGPYHEQRTHRY